MRTLHQATKWLYPDAPMKLIKNEIIRSDEWLIRETFRILKRTPWRQIEIREENGMVALFVDDPLKGE